MVWSFLLATALAYVMFRLGGYVMMLSIYTGIAQGAVIIMVLGLAVWLYRRFVRGRRGRVPQIPHL